VHELIIGRYRPLRPLGSGGMGQVWLARDESSGLDVALKVVGREGRAAERAEREARAAAALRHPRCQRIYALARDSAHVYIVYEYVPGRTMRQALRAGEVDDRAAIEVAAQVLDALAHAHGRGIVHRDVKPSNVLIAESNGAGVHQHHSIDVRLLDFGLAQMAEFDTLTSVGDVPGTLAYVSPERLLGQAATSAADVWAVGVMLWEALAGEHPFWVGGFAETSRRIQEGAPPLSHRRPDLPRSLSDLVASALLVNPGRRPAAGRLADELRSLPGKRRRRTGGSAPKAPARTRAVTAVPSRFLPAGLAGVAAGWASSALPFYPAHWPAGLAAAATALGFAAPRAGLAFALATAFLPLANVSVGLALVYAALAAGWLALAWRDARAGLVVAAGPLLAPLAALALLPLAAQLARGRARRAAQAAAAVLLAAVVAGLRRAPLPFDGSAPPLGLGISGSDKPGAVAYALWHALAQHPALVAEAAVLAAAAAALPQARGRGPWPAAIFASALLAATVVAAPTAAVAPFVAAAWITAAALAVQSKN